MRNNTLVGFAALAVTTLVATCPCQAETYAKLSPFTGVRWEGDQPLVKIESQWFSLVSLDEIAAKDMVAFSKRAFGDIWQKRFEEDLVELLVGMEHEAKGTVQLVVIPVGESESRTLDHVAMTNANRDSIRDAALERQERESATHPAVTLAKPERFHKAIDEFLNTAWLKAGFSGAVAVAP